MAQLLDQEVVGWYENESDKTKMSTGGMGGMGSMGVWAAAMGDMGMSSDSGMGGMGDMSGGMSGGMPGAWVEEWETCQRWQRRPARSQTIDSQSWDLRIARRKLNMYTQLSHALLKGTLSKDERDYNATGKGIMEAALPLSHQRAGKFLIEALEEVQETINERSLTSVGTLMGVGFAFDETPRCCRADSAFEEPDPKDKEKMIEVVKSFKDYSPRMKSFKKADASGKLESAVKAHQPQLMVPQGQVLQEPVPQGRALQEHQLLMARIQRIHLRPELNRLPAARSPQRTRR